MPTSKRDVDTNFQGYTSSKMSGQPFTFKHSLWVALTLCRVVFCRFNKLKTFFVMTLTSLRNCITVYAMYEQFLSYWRSRTASCSLNVKNTPFLSCHTPVLMSFFNDFNQFKAFYAMHLKNSRTCMDNRWAVRKLKTFQIAFLNVTDFF